MTIRRFPLLVFVSGIAFILNAAVPVNCLAASVFVVNSTGDAADASAGNGVCETAAGNGVCTLRAALEESNALAGADTIRFSVTGVINLTGALPDILDPVTITGPGADKLTVRRDTGGSYRIFRVSTSGATTLSGIKIQNGDASGFVYGGGIYNASGTLNITSCVIANNVATEGGGIYNGATLNLTASTVLSNSAIGMSGSCLSSLLSGIGGGIENQGTLTVRNSTISANSATATANCSSGVSALGGGIYDHGGTLSVINSTIADNSAASFAPAGSGNVGEGGGIYHGNSTTSVLNTTVANNSASHTSGGIRNASSINVVVAQSSLIALNGAPSSPDVAGIFFSQGFNLVGKSDGSSGFTAATDQTGTNAGPLDPKLDPNGLQNNGGPTKTIALLLGSPAMDKGIANGLTTDQRGGGFTRTFNYAAIPNASGGDGTDIGAFEMGGPRSDSNRDGFTDYLLFNPTSGQNAIWYLHGAAFAAAAGGKTLPAGWSLVGVADFNQNRTPDYILFNSSTRQTAIWFLDNATFTGSRAGPTLPSGWSLISAVDMNSDARPDYLLFNAATRQTVVWVLNGTAFVRAVSGPTLPSGWTLIDALDFNMDDEPDYVLFNPSTRQTAIWYLDGTTRVAYGSGPTLPAGWTLKGASEFNTDGKPDFVLFNPSTLHTAIWYLNGRSLTGYAAGPTLPAGFDLVAP